MNRRPLFPLIIAALLLASGCSTTKTTPILGSQPGFEPAPGLSTQQLSVAGAEVRNTRIFVDIVALGEAVNGLPVLNVAHGTEAGNAALAALQAAGVETRIIDDFWPLADAVARSTLQFSIIRKRDALQRGG